MSISNVALTNTFDEWRVTTNQLIVVTNDLLGDGLTTYRSVTANVVTANSLFVNSLNVLSSLSSSFGKANSANIIASAAFDKANSANIVGSAAFGQANAGYSQANAGYSQANAAFTQGNTAYSSAVLKTGNTMTGNLVLSGANISFVQAASNLGLYWAGETSFIHSPASKTIVIGTSSNPEVMRIENFSVLLNGSLGVGTGIVPRSVLSFDITGASAGRITTLTDGATITPDFASNNNFTVTLGGNRTLANATSATVGQSGVIYVVQDSTGSRTLSFGLAYKFVDNSAPTLTTTANAVDAIVYSVRTANSYVCQAILNVGNRNDT